MKKLTIMFESDHSKLNALEDLTELQELEINSGFLHKDLSSLLKLKQLKSLRVRAGASEDNKVIKELEKRGVRVILGNRHFLRINL
mgnify:FL=1